MIAVSISSVQKEGTNVAIAVRDNVFHSSAAAGNVAGVVEWVSPDTDRVRMRVTARNNWLYTHGETITMPLCTFRHRGDDEL